MSLVAKRKYGRLAASLLLALILLIAGAVVPAKAAVDPDEPQNIFVSWVSPTQFQLTWEPPIGKTPTRYQLDYRCANSGYGQYFPSASERAITVPCVGAIKHIWLGAWFTGGTWASGDALDAAVAVDGLQKAGNTLRVQLIGRSWDIGYAATYTWLVNGQVALRDSETFAVTASNENSQIAVEVTSDFWLPDVVKTFTAQPFKPMVQFDSCVATGCAAPTRFHKIKGAITPNGQSGWKLGLFMDGTRMDLNHQRVGQDLEWTSIAENGSSVVSRVTNADYNSWPGPFAKGSSPSSFDIYIDRNALSPGVHTFKLVAYHNCDGDPRRQVCEFEEPYSFDVEGVAPYLGNLQVTQFKTSATVDLEINWPKEVKAGSYILNWWLSGELFKTTTLDATNPESSVSFTIDPLPSSSFTVYAYPGWDGAKSKSESFDLDRSLLQTSLNALELTQSGKSVSAKVTGTFAKWTDKTQLTLDWFVDDVYFASTVQVIGPGDFESSVELGALNSGSRFIQVQVRNEGVWRRDSISVAPTEGPISAEWVGGFSSPAIPNSTVTLTGRLFSDFPFASPTVRYRFKTSGAAWSKYSSVKVSRTKTFSISQKVTKETIVEVSYFDPVRSRTVTVRETVLVAPKITIKKSYKASKIGRLEYGGTWTFTVTGPGGYAECGAILRAPAATSPFLPGHFEDQGLGVGAGSSKVWSFTAKQKFNGYYSIWATCLYKGFSARTVKVN